MQIIVKKYINNLEVENIGAAINNITDYDIT